jgi:phage-related protein
MKFFGKKEKQQEYEKILTELQNIKKDFRLLFDKLDSKIDEKHDEIIQYFSQMVETLETISSLIKGINNEIKNLSDSFRDSISDLKIDLDSKSEVQIRLLNQILKKFTTLVKVIGDILQEEITVASGRIKKALEEAPE